MTDRADTAGARHERGHFGKRTAFAEFFETPELGNVKLCVGHTAMVIEEERDLGVAFDARYWIDADRLTLCLRAQVPNRDMVAVSGILPESSSSTTWKIWSALGGHPGRKTSTFTILCTGRD